MQAQRITTVLIDKSAGFKAGLERIRLFNLADFSADVADILRGANKDVNNETLEIATRSGFLAIETTPLSAAPQLFNDLRALLARNLLESADVKRWEAMERRQRAARNTRQIASRITAPFLDQPILINSESDYRVDDADQWVRVERYIRGEIQDISGAIKANAYVKLLDGRPLTVTTDRNVLKNDMVNRLYKPSMLRIKADYNVVKRELRNALLVEFVEHSSRVDEE